MSGPTPRGNFGQISRRVVQCHGLMCLLSTTSPHSEDVLVIPADDVERSEGIEGASQQPVVPDPIALSLGVSSQSSGDSVERLLHKPAVVKIPYGVPVFVPEWNLRPDSRMYVHYVALKFTYHALPPVTVEDMDSMNNVALAHSLAYAVAQAVTYLVVGSWRVQRLNDLEHAYSALVASESSLKGEVTDLGATVHRLD